jgi:hypothetical protein
VGITSKRERERRKKKNEDGKTNHGTFLVQRMFKVKSGEKDGKEKKRNLFDNLLRYDQKERNVKRRRSVRMKKKSQSKKPSAMGNRKAIPSIVDASFVVTGRPSTVERTSAQAGALLGSGAERGGRRRTMRRQRPGQRTTPGRIPKHSPGTRNGDMSET